MSPRSSLRFPYQDQRKVLDPVLGGKKCKPEECFGIPKVPIVKRVRFSSCEIISIDPSFTQAISKETIPIIERERDDHICHENCYDDTYIMKPTTSVTDTVIGITQSFERTRRPKVRWSNRIRVWEIRHLNDMSENEREKVWLTPVDYKLIKNMAKATVFMMTSGENIDADNPYFCTRGLEHRTRAGSRIRNENKLAVRSAVLGEQDLQREECHFDPALVAMVSIEESFDCKEIARKRALDDAHAAESYMNETCREVRVVLF